MSNVRDELLRCGVHHADVAEHCPAVERAVASGLDLPTIVALIVQYGGLVLAILARLFPPTPPAPTP